METPEINPLDKLKPNHQKFVQAYLDCMNAAEAARRAGYSKKTARQQGQRLLTNVDIRNAISFLGEQTGMTTGEAFRHITDIARTRLNDYMIIRPVLRTPMVRQPLTVLIERLKAEINFEEQVAQKADYDKNELKRHNTKQRERSMQLMRYELELAENPKAYRDVAGESIWVDEAYLDMVALAKAESMGRIKSLSFTEFGPKVELYSAETALDKVMQLHGRYKQLPGDANQPKELQSYKLPDGSVIVF